MFTKKQAITAIFGAKLRRIRQEQRLSQKGLAEKIGVGEMTVTKYELGHMTPGIDKLVALAEALEVPVTELLGEDGATKQERRFERCVEMARKLGYDVSAMDIGELILVERRAPYTPQGKLLIKEDFIRRMEALEDFALTLQRVRDFATEVLSVTNKE